MNRHDLETAAKALESSGYCLYRSDSADGANMNRYSPVPWEAALVRIMSAFGWIIGPEVEDDAPRPELRIEP